MNQISVLELFPYLLVPGLLFDIRADFQFSCKEKLFGPKSKQYTVYDPAQPWFLLLPDIWQNLHLIPS